MPSQVFTRPQRGYPLPSWPWRGRREMVTDCMKQNVPDPQAGSSTLCDKRLIDRSAHHFAANIRCVISRQDYMSMDTANLMLHRAASGHQFQLVQAKAGEIGVRQRSKRSRPLRPPTPNRRPTFDGAAYAHPAPKRRPESRSAGSSTSKQAHAPRSPSRRAEIAMLQAPQQFVSISRRRQAKGLLPKTTLQHYRRLAIELRRQLL